MWRRGVVIITTAQLHSSKPELRFCAGSNPARREIRDGEDLWQWALSSVNHTTKTIHHHHHHPNIRSSHPVVFREKDVLESFAKFPRKHPPYR